MALQQMFHKKSPFSFILSVLFSFYPGQILSAASLKIVPSEKKKLKKRDNPSAFDDDRKVVNNFLASAYRSFICPFFFFFAKWAVPSPNGKTRIAVSLI